MIPQPVQIKEDQWPKKVEIQFLRKISVIRLVAVVFGVFLEIILEGLLGIGPL